MQSDSLYAALASIGVKQISVVFSFILRGRRMLYARNLDGTAPISIACLKNKTILEKG